LLKVALFLEDGQEGGESAEREDDVDVEVSAFILRL